MTTISVTVVDDAQIRSDFAGNNYGSGTIIALGGTVNGLFRFDLSGIPAGAVINSATFTLTHPASGSTAGTLNVKAVTGTWTEGTVTYTTRPAVTTVSGQATLTGTTGGTGTTISVDIAPAITYLLANSKDSIEISGTGSQSVASTEHATTGYRPTLSVTYTTNVDLTYNATPMSVSSIAMPTPAVSATKTVNYAAEVMAVSVAAVDPTVSAARNATVSATPFAVSVSMVPGYGQGKRLFVQSPSEDLYFSSISGNSDIGENFVAGANRFYGAKFDASDPAPYDHLTSAKLRLYNAENTTAYFTPVIYKITSAWTEATVTIPTKTLVATLAPVTVAAHSTYEIDVSQWIVDPGYGLAFTTTGDSASIASKEVSDASHRPQLTVLFSTPDQTVVAEPMTVAVAMPSPAVSVQTNRTVSASPMTVSIAAVAPVVSADSNPDMTFNAEPATVSVEFMGGLFTSPVNVTADVSLVSISAPDAAVSTERNGLVVAGPMTVGVRFVPPLEAQAETEDPYYNRVKNQVYGNYDLWYRLDEIGPLTVAVTHAPLTAPNGVYVGNPTSDLTGPLGRRAVQFDGADDAINLPDFTDNGVTSGVFEFVIKTAKPTQNIVYGSDRVINLVEQSTPFMDSIGTINGKVRLTIGNTLGAQTEFVGNTDISDDEWHHIVLVFDAVRVSVYVDGQLDFARRLTERQHFIAIPDLIGGGSFQGEMMEFVFRASHTISADDVLRNYYAVQGWIPNYADPMAVDVAMGTKSKGKGNGKRALALYYNGNDATSDLFDTDSHYIWTEIVGHVNAAGSEAASFDMGEYKVFPRSVLRSHVNTDEYLGGEYYDEVTGEPRYIDLTTDVDTTDYDMVFFIDLPPRINPSDPSQRNEPYYTMVQKLREAQDETGFSLWVPQPELAQDLGIIVEPAVHSMMRESKISANQGNAIGFYDYRSALVNPWQSAADADTNAYFYWDMHALNRYRVTAIIEGLTTLNGYIDADYFLYRPRDPFSLDLKAWKYRELTDGLHIGDEFLFGMQDFYAEASSAGGNFIRQYDRFTVVAVRPEHVKAGTVVTTENATHWVGASQATNPYKDYATTIVLQPGDSLNGHPVNGRIFVNFMEGAVALGWTTLAKQVVPADDEIQNVHDKEGPAKRAWDYSTYRQTTTGVTGTVSSNTQQIGENSQVNPAQGGSTITSVNVAEKYPVVQVRRYGMAERGLHWLADRVVRQEGDVVIRVAPMAVSVAAGQNGLVRADKDTNVHVQAALVSVQMVKPNGTNDPDVSVSALPMTVDVKFNAPSRVIKAEPMVVSVAMVQPVSETLGEQVVLYLDTHDATLFLLEEA